MLTHPNALGAFVAGRRRAMTGAIPLRAVLPLMVEEDAEPVFAALVAELGASWLGIAADVSEGRIMAADEQLPPAVALGPEAVAS